MNCDRGDLARVFILALVVRAGMAILIRQPGYMDTAYYASGAMRLAQNEGLTEPFIWNYLDDPKGLPQPAYLYWMPLPSLLSALPAALFPGSFLALQLPFVLLSALLPPITYGISWHVTSSRRLAWIAALLMLFSGFYFTFWTLPETFAPFAVVGCLALWMTAHSAERRVAVQWGHREARRMVSTVVLAGVLAGLAHLTRADGVLVLFVAVLGIGWGVWRNGGGRRRGLWAAISLVCLLAGYLLVMTPWFVRNISLIGRPLAAGGSKTLLLTTYDDLYSYGADISLRSYLAWGWANILRSKLWALGVNLERLMAENCLIFLLPFVLLGLYRRRRCAALLLPGAYLVVAVLAHSIAFTFPGPRGGLFHAGSATLPFLMAAGADGLDSAVRWAAGRRHWRARQAQGVFGTAAVVGAIALSGYATAVKIPQWRVADIAYIRTGEWLAGHVTGHPVVMSGNPPAFWYHTSCSGVVVPNGGTETVLEAADRYGVEYVVLDENHPILLSELYAGESQHPRLVPLDVGADDVRVFSVQPG
ncbi:MAG: hypothetical protein MUQ10_01205 [Anaerolineae bacterium]|nr:hypothetical protein [Anaerolineae bacterium]